MLAKSFRALTKFLIPLLIASPVLAGNVFTPISVTNGARTDYQSSNNIIGIGVNLAKLVSGSLSSEDRHTHLSAVMFAMQNSDNGETVVWYNTATDTSGRIRITVSFPVQGGICRNFFTEVRIKERVREYEEQGCKTIDSRFWVFSGR
jgi:surface antigen